MPVPLTAPAARGARARCWSARGLLDHAEGGLDGVRDSDIRLHVSIHQLLHRIGAERHGLESLRDRVVGVLAVNVGFVTALPFWPTCGRIQYLP